MENSTIQEQDFLGPLGESVVQRDYTKPNVSIQDVEPIPEAEFAKPSFEELDAQFKESLGETKPEETDSRKVYGAGQPVSSANPYQETLDKKDQKQGSKAMADAILDGYGQLKSFGNSLIKIDVAKVKKAIRDGLIDPNIQIPVEGRLIPLMTYIEAYNAETEGTISMSDDFRQKVHPVLMRVLMKRNIGMTDEQLLAYYFGTDIITSGIQVFALRRQNNEIISQLKEMTANTATVTPRNTSGPVEPQQPEPTPQYTPPPTPNEPSGNERQFMEPEEVQQQVNTPKEKFDQYDIIDDMQPEIKTVKKRSSRIVQQHQMPTTDVNILQHMEDLAGSPVKKRGRGRGKKQ